MTQPIVYIDRSRIKPGRIDDVRRMAAELVDYIEDREEQLLFYGFFIDDDAHRMTVVAIHPDAASVELHMEVGREAFRKFTDVIELEAIEVYGEPSGRMVEQLDSKARDLGERGAVTVGALHAGFTRIPAATGRQG